MDSFDQSLEYLLQQQPADFVVRFALRDRGRIEGDAQRCADTIVRILIRRAGTLDPAIETRLRGEQRMRLLPS